MTKRHLLHTKNETLHIGEDGAVEREQMRFELASVGLLDADNQECDPYNIPDGFIATTIAIHLGRRVG